MPQITIVDSHVHLWDPSRFRMSWLDGSPDIDRPMGLADYRSHTAGVDVGGMVYLQVEVEPAYGLMEARWAVERANEEPRLGAIVAWAPLEFGEQARAYLDELVAIDRRIKGVRRLIQGESLDFALQPRFVRGVQLLADYGLTFDICLKHPQLAGAVELVRRCPNVQFILDHIGKPDIAAGLLDPWRAQIRELASLPNVICKVSGMVTEADHARWTTDDLRPYVEHVLESFGEDRVAFGGDWPVVLLASPWRRWVDTLDALTSGLSDDAKRKLWAANARRFYRM
ncbi:MAG TPA: amidohydrolase family protein [Chloroflexota bacterium]|nr:amidohydrolase family protein [Chloroflexota bacterium]